MEAKELRIGNWVNEHGSVIQISLNDGDLWHTENFNPIPLTPDILEKCGFKLSNTDGNWYKSGGNFMPIYRRGKYWGLNGGGLSVREFEFLHQLQNLYYSLTSIELEIKM